MFPKKINSFFTPAFRRLLEESPGILLTPGFQLLQQIPVALTSLHGSKSVREKYDRMAKMDSTLRRAVDVVQLAMTPETPFITGWARIEIVYSPIDNGENIVAKYSFFKKNHADASWIVELECDYQGKHASGFAGKSKKELEEDPRLI